MKPFSSVKAIWELIYTCFVNLDKSGKLGPNNPNHGHQYTESHPKCKIPHFTSSKALFKCKDHLLVKLYLFFLFIFGELEQVGELGPKYPQIKGTNTQKVFQSVKFQISHQMKPCSSVKTICRSSYTCFSIFRELGQVGKIESEYPKSWALIHRKSFIVLNSTFHIKWSCTHLKSIWESLYTCFCAFAKLGQVREI